MHVNNVLLEKAKRSGFLTKVEVVSHQATEVTDYQIKVDDLISRKSDGEDIQFFQKNNILNHWKESYTSWKSDAWAKLPRLPVTKSQILKILSSNPSISNSDDTLALFDDFKGAAVTPVADIFQLHEYENNPVIISSTVSASGYNYPKEPSVIKSGSTYYMAASVWSTYAVPVAANRKVILLKSTDLITWEYVKILKTGVHASCLFYWNGAYHLFYSDAVNDWIGRMHTADIEGVWTDEGNIGIAGGDRRDPYLWIEGGTKYCFYTYSTGGVWGIYERHTNENDFTGWSGENIVAGLPSEVLSLEASKIVKEGSTYYMYTVAHPKNGPFTHNFNCLLFNSSTITGTYSKVRYVMWKEARDSWHKRAVGHISFIRDGDIETNLSVYETNGHYPLFSEGANGTKWAIGYWKGMKTHEYANDWTEIVYEQDITHEKNWLMRYDTDGHARSDYQVSGDWIIKIKKMAVVSQSIDGSSGALEIRQDSTNWYKIYLGPHNNLIKLGKLEGGGWTWVDSYSMTVNDHQEYDLEFHKHGTSIDVYVDEVFKKTFTDSFLNLSGYLALNVHKAHFDVDVTFACKNTSPSPFIIKRKISGKAGIIKSVCGGIAS